MTKLKKVRNFLKILFLLVISSQMSIWTLFFGEISLILTKLPVFYVSHAQSTSQKRFAQNNTTLKRLSQTDTSQNLFTFYKLE